MSFRSVFLAVIVFALTACDPSPPAPPPVSIASAAPAQTAPAMPDAAVDAEFDRLRQAVAQHVPNQADYRAVQDSAWTQAASAALIGSAITIDRPQLIVVVDRNPSVQRLRVILARPTGSWRVVGGGKVSTGQCGRRGYFITPTGVFWHTDAIVDYRALGTFNENGIRGLGIKGMRVWDFGWQAAEPGWGTDRAPREIRMLMHATDPDFLEPRLGRPASQGCVRISTDMNRFLDLQGVLDADHERAAATDPRIAGMLHPARTPSPLAGNMLIVIDSTLDPSRPPP